MNVMKRLYAWLFCVVVFAVLTASFSGCDLDKSNEVSSKNTTFPLVK